MKKCSEVMSKNLVCCLPSDTVVKVAQLMQTQDIGAVPVIDGTQSQRPIGIVTDRDLALGIVAAARDPLLTTAQEVMSGSLVTCRPEDDVQEALEAMSVYQLRRIPVVDRDNRIIGIISQADVATRIDQPKKTAEIVREISTSTLAVMAH